MSPATHLLLQKEFVLTVDTTSPVAPVITGIDGDSGSLVSGGSTNDTTLTIKGTAEARSTVSVMQDGVVIGTAESGSDGNWSLDHTQTPLDDATYKITATTKDPAGNTSPVSKEFVLTVDTTPPELNSPVSEDMAKGEFQINTYAKYGQKSSSVTSLVDGGFVVTWSSNGQDVSGRGIFGQRYDAQGKKFEGEFQINSNAKGHLKHPSVTALKDGGFVVTWNNSTSEIKNPGNLYGQRYDFKGSPAGEEFKINQESIAWKPSVTALKDGGFVVMWEGALDHSDAFGRKYDAQGVPTGGEFRTTIYYNRYAKEPSVTALKDGGFVVMWYGHSRNSDIYGIFGQRFDARGEKAGDKFQFGDYSDRYPSVTTLKDGGFVVAWLGKQGGAKGNIYGLRYDALGEKAGDKFQINTYMKDAQYLPSVTSLVDGGFVVTWAREGQDEDYYSIFGQRYDAQGKRAGEEFQINTYMKTVQDFPSVTSLVDGGFVVTWSSYRQDGSDYGIYGQRYDKDGNPVTEDFINLQHGSNTTSLGDYFVDPTEAGQDLILSGAVPKEEAGKAFQITLGGKAYSGIVASDGTWSVTVPKVDVAVLAEGSHKITYMDAAGNKATQTQTIIVDKTPPDAPVIIGIDAEGQTFSGTAEALSFVKISKDGTTLSAVQTSLDGEWSTTFNAPAGDGDYQITTSDLAGNISQSITATVKSGTIGNDLLGGEVEKINILRGLAGNDILVGKELDDILAGGRGSDTLTGGRGSDTFVFHASEDGEDHITDFNLADKDVLDLRDLLEGENTGNIDDYLTLNFENGNTTITIDKDGSGSSLKMTNIVLHGVNLTETDALNELIASGHILIDL